ncbi:MAG: hypothetical protein A2798_00020 [Candidatus Levybacteria bacterium RIFCSPHIGHO2_01_FULL_37_17]|nr:MAG: hypothetical protein A2798_00020 [Candidatus Levybacteria bacterium RIFCSPHIGHO2_01_FULL_37_17]OGH36519.1 MAG: hypothetical protein A2959_03345 [Candidatus Levybacteria bacterium RIFCSPLOWO2_01_FULL_38_23]
MWFEKRPEGFNPQAEVSGVFIQDGPKFLLLQRNFNKPYGEKWALPGGKSNHGESRTRTAIREVKEETQITLGDSLTYFNTIYEVYPDGDFIYHIFTARLAAIQLVTINYNEHSDFAWVTPYQALQKDLIQDLDDVINMVYPETVEWQNSLRLHKREEKKK